MAQRTGRNPKDLVFEKASAFFALAVLALTVLLFAVLLRESLPASGNSGRVSSSRARGTP